MELTDEVSEKWRDHTVSCMVSFPDIHSDFEYSNGVCLGKGAGLIRGEKEEVDAKAGWEVKLKLIDYYFTTCSKTLLTPCFPFMSGAK
jgi:hypothetical protein